MDESFIIVSVIGLIGSILVTQMWQMNWFKRENFKMQKSNIMAQNKLNLEKMRKEMGLSKQKEVSQSSDTGILDVLKGLDIDKIKPLLKLVGRDEDEDLIEDEPEGDIERILKVVPPDVIQGFLKGLNKKEGGNQGGEGY